VSLENNGFQNQKVEAARRILARYQPFILTVIAVVLIATLLPGRQDAEPDDTASSIATDTSGGITDETPTETDDSSGDTGGVAVEPKAPVAANPEVLTFEEAKKKGVALVANCDPKTGRIKVPSRTAPACTQRFTGKNAGASYQGVDAKTIKVVYFQVAENPATQAILAAADAEDSDAEVQQQVRDWGTYYMAHYNLWGRKIEWTFVKSSAPSSDADNDAAARADAIKVIGLKPFAVINAPANIFVNEVVAKKIMCFCTVSLPIETYIKWYPYVWTTLMASTQGYIHRAQYVGQRLKGRNAKWAQDDIDGPVGQAYQGQKRKFGFLYYDTDDKAYASGAKYFVKIMKEKYGITFCGDCVTEYHGFPDVNRTQEESPGIIQRFKAAGVTSVICSCDPFGPIFFTKDAQQQLYGPEWIITGSALTDTSFFAGLYQQDQWESAFGISYLTARLVEEKSNDYRLLRWQFNKEPSARAGYGVINSPLEIMFRGIMQAGPVLKPQTVAAGLEKLGVVCKGCIVNLAFSFGDQGLWPWKIDPAAADDATEIWWDRQARGENEIGQEQDGLYRYVSKGKRYLPGAWPKTDPFVFNRSNTVTIYNEAPAQDKWPCYPSPATKKMDRC
jgi:hypothetical protein